MSSVILIRLEVERVGSEPGISPRLVLHCVDWLSDELAGASRRDAALESSSRWKEVLGGDLGPEA